MSVRAPFTVLFVLACAVPVLAQGLPQPPVALVIGDQAIFPGPPEVALGPEVTRVEWSVNGQRLLIVRRRMEGPINLESPPPAIPEIHVWDVASRSGRLAYRCPVPGGFIRASGWLPG